MSGKVTTLFAYICVSVLIRFPFFFRDYMDRDESTFILMGQSWADGFLPYTQLWDLKPPLVFLFFAAIIEIFGRSYIAIRLAGTLVIAFTAFFIHEISGKGLSRRAAFFAGLMYIYLASLFGSLQGVMSEHLAMFLFVAGFWQLLITENNSRLAWSAILFGASLMFRLNLIYPTGILFLYYLLSSGWKPKEIALKGSIAVAGGLLVPFLTFLPYWLSHIPATWWNAVILASINYDNPTLGDVLEAVLQLSPFLLIFAFLIWKIKMQGIFYAFPKKIMLTGVVTAGLLFMLVKGGKVNSHYLIQLYPFLILLLIAWLDQWKTKSWKKFQPALAVLFLILPVEAYSEYGKIAQRSLNGQPPYNGYGISIPRYIEEHYAEETSVFFLDYHIGYWELKKLPPRKVVTHPSNLLRLSNYPFIEETQDTPLSELSYILEHCQPDLIISRTPRISFAEKDSQVNEFFEHYLKEHYQLVLEEKKAYVYERRKE